MLPLFHSATNFGTWFDLPLLNSILRPFGLIVAHRDRLQNALRKRRKPSRVECTCNSNATVCLACDHCPDCGGKVS